jgi:hypothetical protein
MSTSNLPITPTWQCVMVCWGTKYSPALIANLIAKIAQYASKPAQYVLMTDAVKPELSAALLDTASIKLTQVLLPDYFNQAHFRTSGCHAKLAMFERGVLPYDLPSIYIDLDTVVCGDLSGALALLNTPKTVAMFQSALLPFGRVARLAARFSDKKHYARGNSSLVVFQPSQCYYIADGFKTLFAQYPDFGFKPLRADERFISWIAQDTIRAIPTRFAVKFPTEFMFPLKAWLWVRAVQPWRVARRKTLVAITLNGLDIKPEKLLALRDGEILTDDKRRYLIWSDRLMGVSKRHIVAFYRDWLQVSKL